MTGGRWAAVLSGSGTETLGGAVNCFNESLHLAEIAGLSVPRDRCSDHPSDPVRYRNPAGRFPACDPLCAMPDPFHLILGFIALLCIALYPIRRWQRSRRSYGDDERRDGEG